MMCKSAISSHTSSCLVILSFFYVSHPTDVLCLIKKQTQAHYLLEDTRPQMYVCTNVSLFIVCNMMVCSFFVSLLRNRIIHKENNRHFLCQCLLRHAFRCLCRRKKRINKPSEIILNFIKLFEIVCNYAKNHINELILFINMIYIFPHHLKNTRKCRQINKY